MNTLPFVISAELDLSKGDSLAYIQPTKLTAFREDLDADLRRAGKNTLWVPSGDITTKLNQVTQQSRVPVVSLDDRYVAGADRYLGISRSIDASLNDDGYAPRQGYASLSAQLEPTKSLGKEILLVDDVLYSGEMITWLSGRLGEIGVRIGAVAVGVAIQEGVDKLMSQGIDVCAAITFDDVEDELCERDLAIVPGSGRRIAATNMNALYFDVDNGKPEQWASIPPESARSFCISSIERSLRLIQPSLPIESLGRFKGYDATGAASGALLKRIGELR